MIKSYFQKKNTENTALKGEFKKVKHSIFDHITTPHTQP